MRRLSGKVVITICFAVNASLAVTLTLTLGGCKNESKSAAEPAQKNETAAANWDIKVTFGPEAKCPDPSVNEFVTQAVKYCATGNYEEYRLLWSYDHRPTSRKRFLQLWEAIEQFEVKLVKQILLQLTNGSFLERDGPVYVFHAFIKIKPEMKLKPNNKFEDRDMILQIVKEGDSWRFMPARDEVKKTILDSYRSSQPGSEPSTQPASPAAADI